MNPMDLRNDIVVFDMDGVLTQYNFEELGVKVLPEQEWIRENMQRDMYKFVKKTSLFDELINNMNPMDMYVLSTAFTSFEQNNKINLIEEQYGNIREDNIIFVAKDEYKAIILQELRDIYDKSNKQNKRIILIEDTARIMISVEELKDNRIKCYLISDFI